MHKDEKFWDKTAKKYSKSDIKDKEGYHKTLEDTKKYLGRDKAVLEIGCGTGTTALILAEFVKDLTATDISSEMITIANEKKDAQKVSNVHFAQATLSDDSLKEGSFDVILANNLIHLLDNTDQVMKRIHALLKPGGVFIQKTACLREKSIFWPMIAFVMGKIFGLSCIQNFTIAELEEIMAREGFRTLETHIYPPKPIRLFAVAKKRNE